MRTGAPGRAESPGLLPDPDQASAAVLASVRLPLRVTQHARWATTSRAGAVPVSQPYGPAQRVQRSLAAAAVTSRGVAKQLSRLANTRPAGVLLAQRRGRLSKSQRAPRQRCWCGLVGAVDGRRKAQVDLQQVTIIPHNEWKRIQDSLDSLTREAACLRAERKAKKEMHFRSQEVGMKEQKLEAKKKRDEEIEAERQILDIEEEIHKQGERKKAIEFAKQYQFYQTERVKHFHSGLLLSRVMKERDAQIEFQKKKIKSDKKWEEQLKLSIEKAFKEEQERAEKRRRDRMALANDHLKQYEHMNDKNIIKAVERQQQEEEDEKIRKFIKAKKRLTQIGKEKEAETHRLMEERRERINNFLSELIKEKLDNEDLIIARDTAEAEAEWEKREKEKYEKNKAELKAIAEYRAVVMKNKEEEERQRKQEDKEQLLAILKADRIFQEHEKEKKRKADKERQEVRDAHIQQMAKNKLNTKQEKQAELEYCRLNEALVAEKEKEFQDYAREVIELESESTNKYIYPLVKAVQEGHGGGRGPVFVNRGGLRPCYQANDGAGVQLPFYNSQGSKYSNFQKSKGRLGFT
ncbi:hypothetical protein GH733_008678, partial [Mirounga leonina]